MCNLHFQLPSRAAWNISHSDLLGNRPLHGLWIRRLCANSCCATCTGALVEAYSQVGGKGRKLAVVDPSCLCSCGIVNARCGRRQKSSVSRQLKPQDHRSSASQLHNLQAVLAIARRAYGEGIARCTSCCTYTESYMHTYMRAYMNLSSPLPWTEIEKA